MESQATEVLEAIAPATTRRVRDCTKCWRALSRWQSTLIWPSYKGLTTII
jgi:hypothetical protein